MTKLVDLKTAINYSIKDSPFHIKNFLENPSHFLSWEDVNSCLYRRDIGWELIGENNFKKQTPVKSVPWYGNCYDTSFITQHIRAGGGFVITGYGMYNETTNGLCKEIEEQFQCVSDIHVYGGLKNISQSFKAHSDPTSNFIIQVEGITNWKIFSNKCAMISKEQPVFPDEKDLEIELEINLNPGDLIYIPSRQYHKASPSEKRLSMSIAMLEKTMNTPFINRNIKHVC